MAASANPSGNNQEDTSNGNGAVSHNALSVPDNSVVGPTQAALKHNPGIAVDWSPEEQSILEDLLTKKRKMESERRKITIQLGKTKRKRKRLLIWQNHLLTLQIGLMGLHIMMSMDRADGISYKAIGGMTGELLEQSAQALDQISANFAAFKVHENINIFCQARNNILTIMNEYTLNDMPEIMKQMSPLPVKLNEELANSILPQPALQKKS